MSSVPISTLKKRQEFVHIAAQGQKCVVNSCVIQMCRQPEPMGLVRLGFTATKKLGGAVVRNRVKRRLRAAAREVFPQAARVDHDYVIIGRALAETCDYKVITQDMGYALKRLHGNAGHA